MVAVLTFGVLDANCLKQERSFRTFTTRSLLPNPSFAMNPSLAAPAGAKINYSWAVATVYGPLLVAGLVIALWAHCR
jgi:hypothetical protein